MMRVAIIFALAQALLRRPVPLAEVIVACSGDEHSPGTTEGVWPSHLQRALSLLRNRINDL